jgi:LEA14-like dessication related protein
MSGIVEALTASRLRIAGTVVGVLVVSLLGAFALGVLGTPAVQEVDNRFGEVDDETTVIYTDLVVDNPNPIGIQQGNATIDYAVRMNDVPMATGGREGINVTEGNSTLSFTTRMDNGQIPRWWVTHVNNDERTVVTVDGSVRASILGQRQYDVVQEQEVETDIIGDFNSNETRPVNADDPPPAFSNPVLYVNRTSAQWGEATEQATPIDMEFDLYNPQTLPFTITELGYEITMNGVPVGEGKSDDVAAIPPGATETVRTQARIINPNLDDWWVTHLQNDQVTTLRIEFYAVVSADQLARDLRVPLDRLTYEETIETDIFGNKNTTAGDPPGTTPTPSDGASTPTPDDPLDAPTEDQLPDATPTDDRTDTPTDDDLLS